MTKSSRQPVKKKHNKAKALRNRSTKKTHSTNGPLSPRTQRKIVNGMPKAKLQQLHTEATGTVAPSNVTKAELVKEINHTKVGAQIGAALGAGVGIINEIITRRTLKAYGISPVKSDKVDIENRYFMKAAMGSGLGAAAGATIGAIVRHGKK